MREAWAERVNAALEIHQATRPADEPQPRVDHRSHKRREEAGDGPAQEPERHLGPALAAIARKHKTEEEKAEEAGTRPPPQPAFVRHLEFVRFKNGHVRELWDQAKKAGAAAKAYAESLQAAAQEQAEAMREAIMGQVTAPEEGRHGGALKRLASYFQATPPKASDPWPSTALGGAPLSVERVETKEERKRRKAEEAARERVEGTPHSKQNPPRRRVLPEDEER